MRTLQEKYNGIKKGKYEKAQFLKDARLLLPEMITSVNNYEDSVNILKNRGMIFEVEIPKYKAEKNPGYEIPGNKFSIEDVERGIDAELENMGLDSVLTPSQKDYSKAREKAMKNLEKDRGYYLNKLAGESNNVDKHDKMYAATTTNTKDTFNGLVKAALREDRKKTIKEGRGLTQQLSNIGSQEEIQQYLSSIARDIKLNGRDGYKGWKSEDYVEDFKNYISDKGLEENIKEDIDENTVKYAFKKIIRNILSEGTKKPLNEASVSNLEEFVNYENESNEDLARRIRKASADLADYIYKIEKDYLSVRDHIEDTYIEVGPFMAPALSNAFKDDLEPVLKKYFQIELPKSANLSDEDKEAIEKAREAGTLNEGRKFSIKSAKLKK